MPLSTLRESVLKPLGRYLARHGGLNPLFAPGFNTLISMQLWALQTYERRLPPNPSNAALLDQLTLVIKTFERRPLLLRLIKSIRQFYPEVRIIVVDDSRSTAPVDGVDYVVLPFDSGVSAGRSAGLARVKTPFVMILDDDFVFGRRTNLCRAMQLMKAHEQIDILGGAVITLPAMEFNDSSRTDIYGVDATMAALPPQRVAGLPVRRKVPNFFIARTQKLAKVGWDARLKRLDHVDFFTRAHGVLCTVFDAELRCMHAKSLFDLKYMERRTDIAEDLALLGQRYPGEKIV